MGIKSSRYMAIFAIISLQLSGCGPEKTALVFALNIKNEKGMALIHEKLILLHCDVGPFVTFNNATFEVPESLADQVRASITKEEAEKNGIRIIEKE